MLSVGASAVGTFAFLRKRSLAGDAIAHSVLPGVCLAFLLFDTRELWILLLGAFTTGWISILFVDFITNKSKIKPDAAIGITLSIFFGIGIVLLTYIQQNGNSGQSGLNNFLLGKAAAMSRSDVITMIIVSSIILITLLLFFKEFMLISFDRSFAVSIGLPVRRLEVVLTTLTVLSVAVGIQAVGVVLIAALLITPPAAARFWTNNLKVMFLVSIVIGVIGGISGAYISFLNNKMPTGPWVVSTTSILVVFSILAAPKKGLIAKWLSRKKYRQKVDDENALKLLYHLEEQSPSEKFFNLDQMVERRYWDQKKLVSILNKLTNKDKVVKDGYLYGLSNKGRKEGKRIVRIHRLWEMYLTQKMNIASDHVHDDAEAIEHIITPEMERRLAALLDYPEKDPHDKEIPWP